MASISSGIDGSANGNGSNGQHITTHPASSSLGKSEHAVTSEKSTSRVLHRIAEVRQQEGLSMRGAARQLGKDMTTIRAQEQETTDLLLSELYAWQGVLDVPLIDLLLDHGTALSRPVMERARLVRLMKTAAAISEESQSPSIQLLAARMIDQLLEIMPELKEIGAWHSVGQRRSLDEFGRVFENRISEEMLFNCQEGLQE